MGSGDEADATRAARLIAAGAVGASVAHELRNALAAAESALFLARRDIADRERLARHLELLGSEIRKAHDVVDRVLGLARGEPLRREPTPLAAVIDAARHSLVLPTNVTFEVSVVPHDLEVQSDAILLERVLINLYANAIEALAGRGRGMIATRASLDRSTGGRVPEGGSETVLIEIEDDGPGLPEALRGHVFEPLATTKAHGTGLGLALAKTIVEAHGGAIEVSRGSRGGAVFRFRLPHSAKPTVASSQGVTHLTPSKP